nr:NADH dehydrogenase subunit 9 [Namystynia karyoxenos]
MLCYNVQVGGAVHVLVGVVCCRVVGGLLVVVMVGVNVVVVLVGIFVGWCCVAVSVLVDMVLLCGVGGLSVTILLASMVWLSFSSITARINQCIASLHGVFDGAHVLTLMLSDVGGVFVIGSVTTERLWIDWLSATGVLLKGASAMFFFFFFSVVTGSLGVRYNAGSSRLRLCF